GRRYPMDKIELGLAGLPSPDRFGCDFEAVATAIMTTDTHAKCASRQLNGSRGQVALMGIAKGVGMIEPNMATLLTYFYTDAEIAPAALDEVFKSVMDRTFNALSIDTDTSTSDSAMILANGLGGEVDRAEFEQALYEVALELVLQIAADGEGASKVIEVTVEGARDDAQARRVAKSVVNSPLVKTAVHGADPNWGRIAMAVGKCHEETDIEADSVVIRIGGQEMYPTPVDSAGLAAASAHMAGSHVLIEVDLHIADGRFTAYGCDLTDGYVRINADYTT
ncbi:MAG TPA: ornithine acetyltransferase, partial [Acidimicrobiaceae bacterium]|nr:ornithine acetyltransferase [Acidimicrobiaceae bacterium]